VENSELKLIPGSSILVKTNGELSINYQN